jgi:hypothetical protein
MSGTIRIDAKKAIKDLRTFRASALPYAARNALNRSAFHAREVWQEEIRQSFTLRNKFTERSILVDRATGKQTIGMIATVGSRAPYMGDQERGATVRGKSGHKGIPGPVAAGLPPGADRTKMVRAGNRLGALHVSKAPGRTRRQRNATAIAMAKRKGSKVALLERPSGGRGIFKLMGGRRKPQTRLLWDFSRRSVQVPAEPTLQRTLKAIQPRMQQIHLDSFVEQCRKHKILGY